MMPDGEMEPVHSHDWCLRTAVSSEKLDEFGFAVEFGQLERVIQGSISRFAEKNINLLQDFKNCHPTTEKIVEIMYNEIKIGLESGVSLDWAELMEAEGCWVRYKE